MMQKQKGSEGIPQGHSNDPFSDFLAYGYTRIASATPADPADIHLENRTLRLLAADAISMLCDAIPVLSPEQRAQLHAMAAALHGGKV